MVETGTAWDSVGSGWMGDTNFITTIGDTRIYSSDFNKIYKRLKQKAPLYFK